MRALERLWEGAGPLGESRWRERLVWFRRIVLLHVAARAFLNMPFDPALDAVEMALRAGLVAVGLAGLVPDWGLRAARAAAVLVGVEVLLSVPFVANHAFLELMLLLLLATLDEGEEREGALLLRALRVSLAVFFFHTGLQKLLWGYWFDGQFLAYMAGTDETFAVFFAQLLPAEEMARLHSYNVPGSWTPRPDAGPYRVDWLPFVLLSNGIYLGEMAAGIGMLIPRLRVAAGVLALGLLVGIEAGARELTFGALMTGGLLLFLPGAGTRYAFPVLVLFYLYLAAARLGWVPMFPYSPA